MDVEIRASVDLVGSTLRYAEVEHYGERCRLLRLGSCDFDYDAATHLYGHESQPQLAPVSEALHDVLKRLAADTVQVILNPGNVLFFNSVTPTEISQQELSVQLRSEADYLSGSPSAPMSVFRQPLAHKNSTAEEQWHSVVAVRPDLEARLDQVLEKLDSVDWSLRSNHFCAAHVGQKLSAIPAGGEEGDPAVNEYELLVGWYPEFVSFIFIRNEDLVFAQHMDAMDPADCAFFALHLCESLDLNPEECSAVSLYGQLPSAQDFELLAAVSGERPRLLNPIELVDIEKKTQLENFDASAFVPAMGAIL